MNIKLDNTSAVFFEALEYPEFARPNFYIRKQEESGWAKGVYLMALSEIYHSCQLRIKLHYNANKVKKTGLEIDDIELPIKEVTGGEEQGYYNKKLLEELHLTVRYAGHFGVQPKMFEPLDILSFTEYALWFIRNEFRVQVRETNGGFMRPRTNSYFTYLIAEEGPFFSFPQFKKAFRKLLLDSANIDNLKRILTPYHKTCLEIIKLWNEKLFMIQEQSHKDGKMIAPVIIRAQFKAEELKHSWWEDTSLFDVYHPSPFDNQDFAYFAAAIANLLSNELLGGKEVKLKTTLDNLTGHLIKGIHKLLRNDTDAPFIAEARNGRPLEAPFRNWFSNWLEAGGFRSHCEPQKGNGHIDLLVVHEELGDKILEFKGWWNRDKKKIIHQVYKYLTQFEGDAYIFMINHTRGSIVDKYKAIITSSETGYLSNSWNAEKYGLTAFEYYKSQHCLGPHTKDVFHFIISIH